MQEVPADGDVGRVATLRARLAHRLARHVRTSPAAIAPATPLVSFTFDDVPDSACTTGADLLGAHGARGTYYIAGGLIGTQDLHYRLADQHRLRSLHAAGHEIGSHTHSHVFVPNLDRAAIADESRRNAERLRAAVPGLILESFAFPYGFGSIAAKRALSQHYRSSRGIVPGVNAGRADLQFLRANPLMEGHMDVAGIVRLMDAAVSRRGWLIFYGHDVADRPSPYGCTPSLLEAALQAATERDIPCVTVAEGLRRSV